eukprot:Sspe_Gene.24848::Locus_9890_Transcript_1_1_Confidence_1.000_Length_4191::g.24848::m.24848
MRGARWLCRQTRLLSSKKLVDEDTPPPSQAYVRASAKANEVTKDLLAGRKPNTAGTEEVCKELTEDEKHGILEDMREAVRDAINNRVRALMPNPRIHERVKTGKAGRIAATLDTIR